MKGTDVPVQSLDNPLFFLLRRGKWGNSPEPRGGHHYREITAEIRNHSVVIMEDRDHNPDTTLRLCYTAFIGGRPIGFFIAEGQYATKTWKPFPPANY